MQRGIETYKYYHLFFYKYIFIYIPFFFFFTFVCNVYGCFVVYTLTQINLVLRPDPEFYVEIGSKIKQNKYFDKI